MEATEPFVVYAGSDYSSEFSAISEQLSEIESVLHEIISVAADVEGIFIFFVVVVLCLFVYKFFRIFF